MSVKIKINWDDLNVISEGVRIYKSASEFTSSSLPAVYTTVVYGVDEFEDLNVVENQTYFYMLSCFLGEQEVFTECFEVIASKAEIWVNTAQFLSEMLDRAENYSSSDVTFEFTKMSLTIGTVHKYAGGILAQNGKIYCVPYSVSTAIVINTNTDTAYNVDWSATVTANQSYKGAALAPNGKIYCVPYRDNNILVIDPNTDTCSKTVVDVSAILPSDIALGNLKWSGAVLAPNGKIYGIPLGSKVFLIIDTATNIATTSNLGLTLGSDNFQGAVLAPNGKIYCAPYNSKDVAIIDPATDTATMLDCGLSSGGAKYSNAVLAADGKIYCVPYNRKDFLIIDPTDNSYEIKDFGLTGFWWTDVTAKYSNAVLGADGKLYFFQDSTTEGVIIIDTELQTAKFEKKSLTFSGNYKFGNGVLAPNGTIYVIPRAFANIFKIKKAEGVPNLDISYCLSPHINKF